MSDDPTPQTPDMARLTQELERLNSHRFIQVHNSIPRLIGFQFLRGLAFGLGSVVGATILVSVLAYSLSQIDFIPILGDWAGQLAEQIQLPGSGTGQPSGN